MAVYFASAEQRTIGVDVTAASRATAVTGRPARSRYPRSELLTAGQPRSLMRPHPIVLDMWGVLREELAGVADIGYLQLGVG